MPSHYVQHCLRPACSPCCRDIHCGVTGCRPSAARAPASTQDIQGHDLTELLRRVPLRLDHATSQQTAGRPAQPAPGTESLPGTAPARLRRAGAAQRPQDLPRAVPRCARPHPTLRPGRTWRADAGAGTGTGTGGAGPRQSGGNPSQESQRARQAATVAQLVSRYEREYLPTLKPKTQREYARVLRLYLLPALGTLAVPAVTTNDLAALLRGWHNP